MNNNSYKINYKKNNCKQVGSANANPFIPTPDTHIPYDTPFIFKSETLQKFINSIFNRYKFYIDLYVNLLKVNNVNMWKNIVYKNNLSSWGNWHRQKEGILNKIEMIEYLLKNKIISRNDKIGRIDITPIGHLGGSGKWKVINLADFLKIIKDVWNIIMVYRTKWPITWVF
jgi:hypothetical protein